MILEPVHLLRMLALHRERNIVLVEIPAHTIQVCEAKFILAPFSQQQVFVILIVMVRDDNPIDAEDVNISVHAVLFGKMKHYNIVALDNVAVNMPPEPPGGS